MSVFMFMLVYMLAILNIGNLSEWVINWWMTVSVQFCALLTTELWWCDCCVFSVGSLEDVNISAFHSDSRHLAADWNVHAGEMDSILLEKYLPPWLSPHDCDAVLDTVYCRDTQCSIPYQSAMYVNCYQDQYNFSHCCTECQHVNSTQGFSSSATDSPNVGRGVSGELPTAARAALYFSSSPAEDSDQYALLTWTDNSIQKSQCTIDLPSYS